MSALPVIERELRVRARRKSTFWLRVIAALLASLTVASTLSWAQYQPLGTWRPGKTLFDTLSGLAFIFCLVEGVRQTADCLSQEKREGTLGLLFLTDLSGFDVVLGKLAAASLGSFYALLAVLPAMAAALPAGGLTAGEFWRTQLVLLNTLFFALACGLWASARHQEESRPLMAGLKLALGFTVLAALLEFLLHATPLPSLSPGVAMYLAGDTAYVTQPVRFWLTLVSIHLVGWTLLVLAGRKLSESWRDDAEEPQNPSSAPAANENLKPAPQPVEPAWPYIDTGTTNSSTTPSAAPRLNVEADPAAWLAARSSPHHNLLKFSILVLVLGHLLPGALLMAFAPVRLGVFYTVFYRATEFIPLLLIAFAASRPFAEARRSGSMEMLLSTPLSPKAIAEGQWQNLWRQMRGAVKVALIILAVALVLNFCVTLSRTGGLLTASFSLFNLLHCVQRLLCAIAVCWLGLYLGLKMRSATTAVGLNLFWSIVVPWVASSIFWLIGRLFVPMVFTAGIPWGYWAMALVWYIVGVGYLWQVIAWSKRRLFTRFRELGASLMTEPHEDIWHSTNETANGHQTAHCVGRSEYLLPRLCVRQISGVFAHNILGRCHGAPRPRHDGRGVALEVGGRSVVDSRHRADRGRSAGGLRCAGLVRDSQ